MIVNGMGATPLLELYIVFNAVSELLRGRGVTVARTLVGNYVTSLDMAGFSLTLTEVDEELLPAVGRPGGHRRAALGGVSAVPAEALDAAGVRAWAAAVAAAVVAERDRLTELDAAIGDGDHGINLARGFAAVTAALEYSGRGHPRGGRHPRRPDADLQRRRGQRAALRHVIPGDGQGVRRAHRGGRRAGPGRAHRGPGRHRQAGLGRAGGQDHGRRPHPGVGGMGGRRGRRRRRWPRPRRPPPRPPREGAEATIPMEARRGRASYLGPRSVGHEDPGAASTVLVLAALRDVIAAGG